MKTIQRIASLAVFAVIAASWAAPALGEDFSSVAVGMGPSMAANDASSSAAVAEGSVSGFEPGGRGQAPDPCTQAQIIASPSRPYWDSGAATTQCGNLETDFGWTSLGMGAGVRQRMLVSSVRYGFTPRMDLRWGLINHISQGGGDTPSIAGVGDQSLSATYRFYEQGHWLPAMAFSYGFNIPEASPDKGFGSGFTDHQFLFIASRDLGRIHLDFNTVGTLIGEKHGHNGAAQFGLAATRQVTKKLALILESYGGPQPGTTDRFGAMLTGGTYNLRPWLVLDGAYAQAYTAGSPRQQILVGLTCSRRLGFGPISRGSAIARMLGR